MNWLGRIVGVWIVCTLILSGMITLARSDSAPDVCLIGTAPRRPTLIFDRVSAVIQMMPQRPNAFPVTNYRGAISPTGNFVAYITSQQAQPVNLYIDPAPRGRSLQGAPLCSDRATCWRSIRDSGSVLVERAILDSIGIGWSHRGDRVAYVWGDGKGVLRAAVATPEGTILHSREIASPVLPATATIYFHGWTPTDAFIAFSLFASGEEAALYFWSPEGDQVSRFPLPARNPPYLALAWGGERLAYVTNRVNGETQTLTIVNPKANTAREFPLSDGIEWDIYWSPDGRYLALRYFQPPVWRVDLYDADELHPPLHDVGGVQPSDQPNQRTDAPLLVWSADAHHLLMTRIRADGSRTLTEIAPATGNSTILIAQVVGDILRLESGRLAVTHRSTVGTALTILDANGKNLLTLIDGVDSVRDVQLIPSNSGSADPERVAFITSQGGVYRVWSGTVAGAVIQLGGDLPALELFEVHSDLIAFNWYTPGGGDGGAMAFRPDGTPRYHYKAGGRVQAIFPSPDGRMAAVNMYGADSAEVRFRIVPSDGSEGTPILAAERQMLRPAWSPGGDYLAVRRARAGEPAMLMIYRRDGALIQKFTPPIDFQVFSWIPCGE